MAHTYYSLLLYSARTIVARWKFSIIKVHDVSICGRINEMSYNIISTPRYSMFNNSDDIDVVRVYICFGWKQRKKNEVLKITRVLSCKRKIKIILYYCFLMHFYAKRRTS